MSLERWYAHPDDRRKELEALLKTPVMMEALDILITSQLPNTTPILPGADPIQVNALMNSKREGYFDFYRSLKRLTEIPKPRSKTPAHWGEIKPET